MYFSNTSIFCVRAHDALLLIKKLNVTFFFIVGLVGVSRLFVLLSCFLHIVVVRLDSIFFAIMHLVLRILLTHSSRCQYYGQSKIQFCIFISNFAETTTSTLLASSPYHDPAHNDHFICFHSFYCCFLDIRG
jgi:hypothetical protein